MNAKSDYDAFEREYITGTMSVRELARSHGITNHSRVVVQYRKREWARKREEYQVGASDKAIVYMADQEGVRRAREVRVRDNAIDAIDEAITKMRSDMKSTYRVLRGDKWEDEPRIVIEPKDVAMLIDRLQVLFGNPSSISEERKLGINLNSGPLDAAVLRSIVEATRGLGSGVGGSTSSPIPRLDRTREN